MPYLAALALAALTRWSPVAEHAFYEPRAATEARYAAVAEDIAAVVAEADGHRVEDEALETLTLASIAAAESHIARDVDECRRGGPSWTIFQVSTHRHYACASRRNAARVALYRVRESFAVCARSPMADRLAFYTSGSCTRGHSASRYRAQRAIDAWRELLASEPPAA